VRCQKVTAVLRNLGVVSKVVFAVMRARKTVVSAFADIKGSATNLYAVYLNFCAVETSRDDQVVIGICSNMLLYTVEYYGYLGRFSECP